MLSFLQNVLTLQDILLMKSKHEKCLIFGCIISYN